MNMIVQNWRRNRNSFTFTEGPKQTKSHSLQLDQTSSQDWVGIYRQWLIDIYITPLYSVVVLEQRLTGTCVGLNCWKPLQPCSVTFMFCLHTCTVAVHQEGGAPPVEDTVKVDHLSRTHCDVSHWFVNYRLKALSLACWPSPSWLFVARRDHIWTRGQSWRGIDLYLWLAMVVTCQSHNSNALKHTLLYRLFNTNWNPYFENEHHTVLEKPWN